MDPGGHLVTRWAMAAPAPSRPVRVVCRLRAPAAAGDLLGARLRVVVQDVSFQDTSSVEVARGEYTLVGPGDLDRPVVLVVTLDPARTYAVQARVVRNGRGADQVLPGDLVSVAHHEVRPADGVAEVTVDLTEVRCP